MRVPLQELNVRDEDTMSVATGEEVMSVGRVYNRSAFDAVFVTHVEPDVVFDVEFSKAFVVL